MPTQLNAAEREVLAQNAKDLTYELELKLDRLKGILWELGLGHEGYIINTAQKQIIGEVRTKINTLL